MTGILSLQSLKAIDKEYEYDRLKEEGREDELREMAETVEQHSKSWKAIFELMNETTLRSAS